MITVDYGALTDLQASMRETYEQIEQNLGSLSAQVEAVVAVWEGDASDGFQRTVQSWRDAAADLQSQLAELHNMVGRAHDNQAVTVRANTKIWAGRRS